MKPFSSSKIQQFILTPGTEAKYKKINEEFDLMMRKNRLNPTSVSLGMKAI
jgi:hypothetical protein